jgi:hypothetical protein
MTGQDDGSKGSKSFCCLRTSFSGDSCSMSRREAFTACEHLDCFIHDTDLN